MKRLSMLKKFAMNRKLPVTLIVVPLLKLTNISADNGATMLVTSIKIIVALLVWLKTTQLAIVKVK